MYIRIVFVIHFVYFGLKDIPQNEINTHDRRTDMEEMTDFRHRFRNLRLEKHLTTERLAERLGVSVSLINQYESGRRGPTRTRQETIAAFFGVDVDYLMGRSTIRNASSLADVSANGLSAHEIEILSAYRNAPEEIRKGIATILKVAFPDD